MDTVFRHIRNSRPCLENEKMAARESSHRVHLKFSDFSIVQINIVRVVGKAE